MPGHKRAPVSPRHAKTIAEHHYYPAGRAAPLERVGAEEHPACGEGQGAEGGRTSPSRLENVALKKVARLSPADQRPGGGVMELRAAQSVAHAMPEMSRHHARLPVRAVVSPASRGSSVGRQPGPARKVARIVWNCSPPAGCGTRLARQPTSRDRVWTRSSGRDLVGSRLARQHQVETMRALGCEASVGSPQWTARKASPAVARDRCKFLRGVSEAARRLKSRDVARRRPTAASARVSEAASTP